MIFDDGEEGEIGAFLRARSDLETRSLAAWGLAARTRQWIFNMRSDERSWSSI